MHLVIQVQILDKTVSLHADVKDMNPFFPTHKL